MPSQFEIYVSENAARGTPLVEVMRTAIDGRGLRKCVREALDCGNAEWKLALLKAAGRHAEAKSVVNTMTMMPAHWQHAYGVSELDDALYTLT